MDAPVSGLTEGTLGHLPSKAELEARDATFAVRPLAPSPLDATRRRALAIADMMAVATAYSLLVLVATNGPGTEDIALLAASLPLWVLMNKLMGLYDRDPGLIDKSTLNELPRIAHSVLAGTAILFLAAPLLGTEFDIGRKEIITFMATLAVTMPVSRQIARGTVRRLFASEQVVIAGSGAVASLIARKIGAHEEYGVEVVGCIDGPTLDEYTPSKHLERLGGLDDLEAVCREHEIERVIICFSSVGRTEPLLATVRTAKLLGLKITMVPRLYEVMSSGVEVDQIEGLTTLGLRSFFRSRSSLRIKRTIDVVGAGVGVVVLSPVLAACAIAVKLSSGGPVLYRQQRIGEGSVPFDVLKFRTMIDGADAVKAQFAHLNEATGPMFKIREDPRITRVGRFLRKRSLDELPQLLNVLHGQMSLVGPRPLIPTEDGAIVGRHRTRLDLTPGLTGPWQVHGRNAIPFEEMIELDYLYVADWSLWNDLKLILRTIPVAVYGKGH